MSTSPVPPQQQPPVEFYRSYQYSRCAYVVSKNRDVAGVEALFDTALNNGLAAIVASAWPGDELTSGKKVRPAGALLDKLSERAKNGSVTDPNGKLDRYRVRVVGVTEDTAGAIKLTVSQWSAGDEQKPSQIPHWDDYPTHDVVKIDTVALRAAIEIVYPVRHGRLANGELDSSHIEALVALGEHPTLGGFLNEKIDDQWMKEHSRDEWLRGSAADYVEFLGEKEVARRVELAEEYLPFDPKDRLIAEPLHECPVCWNDTMVCGHADVFGIGIGAGTCIVCGYTRSAAIADDEAMTWKLQNLPGD